MRGHIQGITTAATLWVSAGIGLSVGMGEYLFAAVGTALIFIILKVKSVEERLMSDKRPRRAAAM
jgi:putative Mg2+ transporter-C (MgtC) family protein